MDQSIDSLNVKCLFKKLSLRVFLLYSILKCIFQFCLVISMKHVRHLVGDFGVEKNTLTDFLRREIALDYSPNFLDLSCDEEYIAVAGIVNSKTSITIYNVEDLISKVKFNNNYYHHHNHNQHLISEFHFSISMC